MTKIKIKRALWFLTILWFLILLSFVMIFSPTKIQGNSMENTYKNQQILWGLNYKLKNPLDNNYFGTNLFSIHRNDVLVINSKKFENMEKRQNGLADPLIKRVIALPGETLAIKNHAVFINDRPLHEIYISKNNFIDNVNGKKVSHKNYPYFIKERMFRNNTPNNKNIIVKLSNNNFFAMGDNRNYSWDSRVYGSFNIHDEVQSKIINVGIPIMAVKTILIQVLVILTIAIFILELS
ncbi:signal peptidase I [Bombilactobacillus bombi]|uniref:signal peptidase I n=1 Tax=Bombilactobacillus bombi TaxID=1303590 RepID=UPI0015E629FE|nr:signal peptidase I [Bombilactobacillus bombi]MBA1433685.1 signal peptidase I [Bombilactobacillus bombi]